MGGKASRGSRGLGSPIRGRRLSSGTRPPASACTMPLVGVARGQRVLGYRLAFLQCGVMAERLTLLRG